MTADNQFTVVLVKTHGGDVLFKDVSQAPDWSSIDSIPDVDGSLTSNVELESDWTKQGTEDWVVV